MQVAAYRKRAENGAWLYTEDPGLEPHDWEALYATARDYTQPELREAAVGADEWITWAGGPCPIDEGAVLVDVRLRNGKPESFGPAASFDWSHSPTTTGLDIVAYRVLF